MKKLKDFIFNIIKSINPFSSKDTDNKILYVCKIILTAQVLYFITLIFAETIIIAGSMLFGYNATDNQLPSDIIQIVSYFGYIVPIFAFILYTKKVTKSDSDRIGIDKNYKGIFKGIILGIVSVSLLIVPLVLCGAVKFNGINKDVNYLIFIFTFLTYLTQSAMEEVICRGFIFHRLKEKLPVVIAVIINILFFMIGHFDKMFNDGTVIGIIGIANLILVGLIFSVLTIKDKNIYSAIGFHWIWNALLYCIIGLNLSGNDASNSLFKMEAVNKFLTGYSYGVESSIICTIVLTVILVFLILIPKKSN